MPLHAHDELALLHILGSLHNTVGSHSRHGQLWGHVLDSLVVPGIDKCAVRQETMENTVLLDPDLVGTLVALRILGVLDTVLSLGGNILVESPSEADVDDL